jgi:hypothetical protein
MNGPLSLTVINRGRAADLIQRNECGGTREYRCRITQAAGIGIMAFKTILTVAGPGTAWQADLKVVEGLCEQAEAHLSVLVMALAAPPPIGEYAAVVSDSWLLERQADLKHLTARKQEISAFVAGSAVSGDVVSDYP